MLKTKVKASSVTHLTDARYFAAWEVDILGFKLAPANADGLSPMQVAAIREWVDGPTICGEFGLSSPADILVMAGELQLDIVQVDMLTPTASLQTLQGKVPVLQEIVIEAYTDPTDVAAMLQNHQGLVTAFILNFTKGGIRWADLAAGHPWSSEWLQAWCQNFSVLLEIDLGETAPDAFLDTFPAQGFSLQGGAEEKTGYKSFDELDDFFEALTIKLV